MKRIGSLLIVVALVAAMAGCSINIPISPSPHGGDYGESYTLSITSTAGGSVTTPGEGTFNYDEGTISIDYFIHNFTLRGQI